VLIIAALQTVPTMHSMMPWGLPLTLPSHTAIMTPSESMTNDPISFPVGILFSIPMARRQQMTGMNDLQGKQVSACKLLLF